MFNIQKTLLLILLGILVLPTFAFAVTLESIMVSVVSAVWTIAAAVVVILWIVTGVLFLLAQGNPAKTVSARTALLTSIAGTVLAILAFSAKGLVENFLGL